MTKPDTSMSKGEPGESLKDTMPGISNVRITIERMNGVKYFAAECLFHNLSKEELAPVFEVDRGKDVLKPRRTPIESKIRLAADTLPRLIELIEYSAHDFKRASEMMHHARFGGESD